MKEKIRKFIVNNFFGYRKTLIGNANVVTASKIIAPFFIIMGTLYAIWSIWTIAIIFLIGVAFIIWIAFPFFKYSYFNMWPVQWKEMNDFNKYLYVNDFPERITPEQMEYYIKYLKDKFDKK